jgi:aspartate/methionine/tyrosine aminotransferase
MIAHKRAGRVGEIADFHVLQISNAARALAQQGHDVIRMEIGEPDFSTPKPVIAAAEAALRDSPLGYTCALGGRRSRSFTRAASAWTFPRTA